ncbi:cobalamin (vitamin B12) biosynthesis CbiM protein [Desulforamulus reducens MI-1]|uniref:Cobalamin (Vitamin B12) biosynthesis CbiM protein n=1 Tax=Desulforamulus reducens (strain ATCC BAA-1160 / DSM 100696 / MI-1) TaxID=349161 RepID=A4J7M4_DESRM|nr:energy-coupling factor ABC transporter permease [Desulforamulus reducens]ABO51077.1 cobalamin (vitamin B12) biosynthesis CbiM protein [Desulforamulus reducens MI-1]
MHIPDGFLDVKTWVTASTLSIGALGYSVKKTRQQLSDRQIPQLGVMAAFIFAAQMINFPIAGGTSGHLLGAALATTLLGPWSASIVLATVLIIQCFVFLDGGITALGANIFNMAVLGVIIAWAFNVAIKGIIKGNLGLGLASFAAAWFSVMGAALMTTLELAVSGTVPFNVALPAMLGVHAIIGVGEGLITAVVVLTVLNMGYQPAWFKKEDICCD